MVKQSKTLQKCYKFSIVIEGKELKISKSMTEMCYKGKPAEIRDIFQMHVWRKKICSIRERSRLRSFCNLFKNKKGPSAMHALQFIMLVTRLVLLIIRCDPSPGTSAILLAGITDQILQIIQRSRINFISWTAVMSNHDENSIGLDMMSSLFIPFLLI